MLELPCIIPRGKRKSFSSFLALIPDTHIYAYLPRVVSTGLSVTRAEMADQID